MKNTTNVSEMFELLIKKFAVEVILDHDDGVIAPMYEDMLKQCEMLVECTKILREKLQTLEERLEFLEGKKQIGRLPASHVLIKKNTLN